MTPRKIHALLKVHMDIKKMENGQKTTRNNNESINGYIDTIPGW